MTVKELAQKLGFTVISGETSLQRQIDGVYCCDLLSIVMGRAPADSAWITVMGNINAVAVAVLADVSCIIIAENVQCDAEGKSKALQQDVAVLQSELPVYETAAAVAKLLS
ncbi:DRTGG domain-containing protein [Candidatus Soleaferrea massiliensis]|uniref:DRTGG domain-containing protein n=1 Tax=Candidatus Soleaferrea massiliensis TaxID=1470354 RepID=UPI000590BBA3|nr:DRTGG domain-containing protein [Candidatus Soleaferrea massiliensis]